MQTQFTKAQLATVRAYLAQVRERAEVGNQEWWEVSQSILRSYNRWLCLGCSDMTDNMTAIWWYCYRHKPGSKEWRPVRILRGLIIASERDYVEPAGRIELTDAILRATPTQKKRARMMFIRQFGFETFREKVNPIMRRHGVKALFDAPATSEIRGYVEILSKVAV